MFSLCENDAMFAGPLGKADIIHEVNIISDSDIICRRQTSLKKVLFFRTGVFSVADTRIRTGDLILTKDVLYRLSHISTGDIIADYLPFVKDFFQSFFRFCDKFIHKIGEIGRSDTLILIIPSPCTFFRQSIALFRLICYNSRIWFNIQIMH